MSASRRLRGHQVGDVCARDQQHERHQSGQRSKRAPIVILQIRNTRWRGSQHKLLVQEIVEALFGHADKSFGSFFFERARICLQFGANGLDGNTGLQVGKHSEHAGVVTVT